MAQVKITLIDAVKVRRLTINLPDDESLEKLIPALVRKLGLPEGGYTLKVEGQAAPLAKEKTLFQSGVGEGSTLRLDHTLVEADDEKREFDVVIHDPGPTKIVVIKIIRHLTDLGLGDAKVMAETAGGKVLASVNWDVAQDAKSKLEGAGATVELRDASSQGTEPSPVGLAQQHLAQGESYLEERQYQKALEEFSRAIEIRPDAQAYVGRGQAYNHLDVDLPPYSKESEEVELRNLQHAITDYSRAIELEPKNAEAYLARAEAYNTREDLLGYKPVETHDERGKVTGLSFEPREDEATRSEIQRSYQQAIADCDRAIQLDPNLSRAFELRRDIHIDHEKYEAALEDCNRLVQMEPNNLRHLFRQGECFLMIGQAQNALKNYDTIIQRDPNDYFAYLKRACAFKSLGQDKQADADIKRAKEICISQGSQLHTKWEKNGKLNVEIT